MFMLNVSLPFSDSNTWLIFLICSFVCEEEVWLLWPIWYFKVLEL